MHWIISGQHREFYQEHHWIEFEEMITPSQADQLALHCRKLLAKRLLIVQASLSNASPEEVFLAGRDPFREDRLISKISCHPQLARIASELTGAPVLRLAYEQLLQSSSTSLPLSTSKTPFQILLNDTTCLKEMCSTQGVMGALLICLDRRDLLEDETPSLEEFHLPKKRGSAIFIDPLLPIPLSQLYGQPTGLYLLIVYTHPKSVYIFQEQDPHTHALKKLGYAFGDLLQEKTHPTIYRATLR